MITITFKVSKDLIANNASDETIKAKMKAVEGDKALKVLFDMLGFKQIQKQIEQGKTEFVVTPDKLDEKSKQLYDSNLAEICMLAAFSETDKKEEKEDE